MTMGMLDEKKEAYFCALMPLFANPTQDPSLAVKLYKRSPMRWRHRHMPLSIPPHEPGGANCHLQGRA